MIKTLKEKEIEKILQTGKKWKEINKKKERELVANNKINALVGIVYDRAF